MPHGLKNIQSWVLFYGIGGEDVLRHFDLIVVAPEGHTAEGVRRMKLNKAVALAYVSVLEVPRGKAPPPPNALYWQNQPLVHEEYDNWILDPRSPLTEQRLVELAKSAMQQGYDGVFLDTIGDIETPVLPPVLAGQLVPSAARLVDTLVRQCGPLKVVQNWGLQRLLPLVANLLDGVCWESFPFQSVGPVPSVHPGIRLLHHYQKATGLRVLALNHGIADPGQRRFAREIAERCNFLWYGSPKGYIDLPDELPR